MNGCIVKICHVGEYRVPRGRAEKPVRSSEALRMGVPHPPLPPPRRPHVPHPSPASLPHSLASSTSRSSRSRGARPQAHHTKRRENRNGNSHRIGRGGGCRVRERAHQFISLLTTTRLRRGGGERGGARATKRRKWGIHRPAPHRIRPQTASEGTRASPMTLYAS